MSSTPLRDFLEIPYDQLEEMNLEVKAERLSRAPVSRIREKRLKYLRDEKRIGPERRSGGCRATRATDHLSHRSRPDAASAR